MGDRENALGYLQRAFELYIKLEKTMEAARTSALIGQVYLQQGKLQPAREKLNFALNTFEKLVDHVNGSATLYVLGKLELKANNLPEAENYLRRSIDTTENIRRVSTSQDLTAAFSAAVDDRYQSYVECLMRQHKAQPDKGFDVRAFEASEASRGRALAEILRATGGNFAPGVDAAVMEREKLLRSSLRVKEDVADRRLQTGRSCRPGRRNCAAREGAQPGSRNHSIQLPGFQTNRTSTIPEPAPDTRAGNRR
jgi:tetratricopeptide (TPR) repeat protein